MKLILTLEKSCPRLISTGLLSTLFWLEVSSSRHVAVGTDALLWSTIFPLGATNQFNSASGKSARLRTPRACFSSVSLQSPPARASWWGPWRRRICGGSQLAVRRGKKQTKWRTATASQPLARLLRATHSSACWPRQVLQLVMLGEFNLCYSFISSYKQ